ncbi:unnamed protein product [Effrenium voratum]|nr:unnamed protein product [Effrenium voratum]
MTRMELLDVTETQVSGSMQALVKMTQLRDVYFRKAKQVEGSLDHFRELSKLQELVLCHTQLSGDIKVTKNMPDLSKIDLAFTDVVGDIGVFKGKPKINFINFRSAFVHGNIEIVDSLPGLTHFDVCLTHCEGDLRHLKAAPGLRYVDLTSTSVSGDIAVFKDMKGLEYLLLFRDEMVSGDIRVFENTPRLKKLGLRLTNVTGDIKVFRHTSLLDKLHVRNTRVFGDIKVFQATSMLNNADLTDRCSGDIQVFQTLRRLEKLVLMSPKVYGDIKAFAKCPILEELDLTDAPVAGDIMVFNSQKMKPSLRKLYLPRTKVTGDLQNIIHWPKILDVEFMGTEIYGSISQAWRGKLRELRTLKLSASKVTFLPNKTELLGLKELWSRHLRKSKKSGKRAEENRLMAKELFPSLSVLDISRCPVNGTFEDLITILASCVHLASIIAPDAGLRGTIPNLATMEVTVNGKPSVLWRSPLTTSLQTLDLSNNNISFVERFPDSSQAVILMNQPSLKIQPGGLKRAVLRDLYVDLRGTKLADRREASWLLSEGVLEISRHRSMGEVPRKPVDAEQMLQGVDCRLCPPNTYSHGGNDNSTSPEGTTSAKHCECHYGSIYRKTNATSERETLALGRWACGCQTGYAQKDGPAARGSNCVDCGDLHLDCSAFGLDAEVALPRPGFARLRKGQTATYECMPPKEAGHADDADGWEVQYVETLQLSVVAIQDSLNLQCLFDGALVRLGSALASPLVPLLLLALCAVLELFARSYGIVLCLQTLTVTFVGGASSCAFILSCHHADGGGEDLGEGAFRKIFPTLLCNESNTLVRYVDAVGWTAALSYAIFIPLFLLRIFSKQHYALRSGKSCAATSEDNGRDLIVRLMNLRNAKDALKLEGDMLTKRLVAAAVAHISVLVAGRVVLKLEDEKAVVRMVEGKSHRDKGTADAVEQYLGELDEPGLMFHMETLRAQTIMQMLTERCRIQELESQDRLLAGSKHVLFQYALCCHVWMEVVLKLVAVALVSVVNSDEGLKLALAVTLAMAAMVFAVQPYAQPQANSLTSFCFLCLAGASLGFSFHLSWLSRSALLAPFLLCAKQALWPDSPEALAVRLFQELEPKLAELQQGAEVELSAEKVSFL